MQEDKPVFPVVLNEIVRWGEMDAFQHLNNVHYFRMFENVRIQYFAEAGILAPELGQGIGPILAETGCRYRAPVKYPAKLAVSARVAKIYKHGFFHDYEMTDLETKVVVATGSARIVVYDYRSGTVGLVSDAMLAAISRLEGRKLVIEER